jgi:hypothetical protein
MSWSLSASPVGAVVLVGGLLYPDRDAVQLIGGAVVVGEREAELITGGDLVGDCP